MLRPRSTPWIHRWSRLIIAAIAALGVIENAYLTLIKLSGGTAVCPTSGCTEVLNSPYANVWGLPLTLFGLLAYASILALAVAPFPVNPVTQKSLRSKVENWTWFLLFLLATSMLIFSGYLMYLLFFQIQAVCVYCIASALFCLSIFVLTLVGHRWDDIAQLVLPGLGVAMITAIVALGLYNSVNLASGNSNDANIPGEGGPAVTTTSGPAEIALARHLTEIGAKEYGAFWCPHCYDQKQLFGKEAFAIIDYVECDPKGKNPRPQLCQQAGIEGFPTWEINKTLYPGVQPLDELAKASGYQGPQNFKN